MQVGGGGKESILQKSHCINSDEISNTGSKYIVWK